MLAALTEYKGSNIQGLNQYAKYICIKEHHTQYAQDKPCQAPHIKDYMENKQP